MFIALAPGLRCVVWRCRAPCRADAVASSASSALVGLQRGLGLVGQRVGLVEQLEQELDGHQDRRR